jgi:MFS family permease
MVGVSAIARPDRKVQLLTLGACCFGLFMVMLDNTVVNVALPSIQRELGATVSGLALVLDAYVLVFASLLLTAGSLGDRYGRRRVFRAGLVVFTAASALCGLAPPCRPWSPPGPCRRWGRRPCCPAPWPC